jgi:hypothetical protein
MWSRRSEPLAKNALVICRHSDGPALKQRIWNGGKTGFQLQSMTAWVRVGDDDQFTLVTCSVSNRTSS